MSSSSKVICQATASLKKELGVLTLTKRKLTWASTKNVTGEPELTISSSNINGLFASKAGAAEPKLKVAVESGTPQTFGFPNPADAQTFKDQLSIISKKNIEKSQPATPAANGTPQGTPTQAGPSDSTPTTSRINSGLGIPQTASNAVSMPGSRSSSVAPGRAQNKNELKRKVLIRSQELANLHRELVISGQITESEFWESREHLILAEAAADGQRKGKSNQIVDPRPVRLDSGEAKTRLTNQMIEDIFDEFPVVRRAYEENVPKKLDDKQFWTRYLQSKLASRNSASARGAASEHTVKNDSIFDKYLEKEDDGIEPQKQRGAVSQLLIDLAATEEDHEILNSKDVTMQAGRQKQALPLIRRFNEHSERLLNSALGMEPPVKRRRVDEHHGEDDYYDSIVIDDLQEQATSSGVALEMKDQQRYFEGNKAAAQGEASGDSEEVDTASVLPGIIRSVDDWGAGMAATKIDKKASEDAVLRMTNNVKARVEVKSRRYDLPDEIHQDMVSLQTTTTELLRQYWSTVYPPPPDQVLSVATPAQLASRAEKMVGYLEKTRPKVEALLQKARQLGLDVSRIEVVFQPTIQAVQKALSTHASRTIRR